MMEHRAGAPAIESGPGGPARAAVKPLEGHREEPDDRELLLGAHEPEVAEAFAAALQEAYEQGRQDALAGLESADEPAAAGDLCQALLSAGCLHVVLAASPARDVLLTAERWGLGDRCVTVLGVRSLAPALLDEATLAAAVRAVVEQAHAGPRNDQRVREDAARAGSPPPTPAGAVTSPANRRVLAEGGTS